jgi:steroid delta-isomerase
MSAQPEGAAGDYAGFFENLSPRDLDDLERVFTPDARFVDPFNDARGVAEIAAVFRHMYAHTEGPRFRVHDWQARGGTGYYHWTFTARVRRRELTIRGLSRVEFAADGRVREHRDYWDSGTELYARLPLLRALWRAVGRRLTATRLPGSGP